MGLHPRALNTELPGPHSLPITHATQPATRVQPPVSYAVRPPSAADGRRWQWCMPGAGHQPIYIAVGCVVGTVLRRAPLITAVMPTNAADTVLGTKELLCAIMAARAGLPGARLSDMYAMLTVCRAVVPTVEACLARHIAKTSALRLMLRDGLVLDMRNHAAIPVRHLSLLLDNGVSFRLFLAGRSGHTGEQQARGRAVCDGLVRRMIQSCPDLLHSGTSLVHDWLCPMLSQEPLPGSSASQLLCRKMQCTLDLDVRACLPSRPEPGMPHLTADAILVP